LFGKKKRRKFQDIPQLRWGFIYSSRPFFARPKRNDPDCRGVRFSAVFGSALPSAFIPEIFLLVISIQIFFPFHADLGSQGLVYFQIFLQNMNSDTFVCI